MFSYFVQNEFSMCSLRVRKLRFKIKTWVNQIRFVNLYIYNIYSIMYVGLILFLKEHCLRMVWELFGVSIDTIAICTRIQYIRYYVCELDSFIKDCKMKFFGEHIQGQQIIQRYNVYGIVYVSQIPLLDDYRMKIRIICRGNFLLSTIYLQTIDWCDSIQNLHQCCSTTIVNISHIISNWECSLCFLFLCVSNCVEQWSIQSEKYYLHT
eukprot:TRINITY_DN6410_c0_g1_i10.p2 TRINITY_DN6410_c0_g1~~TRINITY_DN6410_c0_g1_i10.p2  ORF type:complete len:209 (-),score=-16.00 TRINITY_DN6410_c0_g1_i10:78-704(-)